MSLSTLIVQREIASIREVEEALARQVLYGGDLMTNVLEVCPLREAALLSLVAESMNRPPTPPGELARPDETARRLLASEVLVARSLAPLEVDSSVFTVAVAELLRADVEQDLGFALSRSIVQVIAPLVRIHQALTRDYGIPLDRRSARILERIQRAADDGPSVPPPAMLGLSSKLNAARGPSLPPEPVTDKVTDTSEPSVRPSPEGGVRSLRRAMATPSMRPLRRRRGAFTASMAEEELLDARERDTIFDLVFEFARQYFDYTAMFVVHGEVAEGRDAYGDGAARENVARIGVPLDLPSLLAAARESKTTVLRALSSSGLDAVLQTDLALRGAGTRAVVPLVVRARVVALLFGDFGEADVDTRSLVDVEGVVVHATAAFERLVVRRKLQSSIVPADLGSLAVRRDVVIPRVGDSLPPSLAALIGFAGPSLAPPGPAKSVEPSVPPLAAATGVRHGVPEPPVDTADERAPEVKVSRMGRREAPTLDFAGASVPGSTFGDSFDRDEVERQRQDRAPLEEDATPLVPPTESVAPEDRDTPLAPVTAAFTEDREPSARANAGPGEGLVVPPTAAQSKPMPASEQQVSVSPRRPPLPHSDESRVLPSVIVDIAVEYVELVERVIAADKGQAIDRSVHTADDAETELLRGGASALPAMIARFPGPVTVGFDSIFDAALPRAAECGPVLRLVASQRRTALPFVLTLVSEASVEKRFWATYLLTELVYPDTLEPLMLRIFDEDRRVRFAALAAVRAFADAHPSTLVERLEVVAMDGSEQAARRTMAIQALGETRSTSAVHALVKVLIDPDLDIAHAIRDALVGLTLQDFGTSAQKWHAWWEDNRERHRLEWLIDALMHDEPRLRAAAGEQLKTTTHEYFGYYDDLPKRERERAQSRYREWWASVGRVRFGRS